MPRDANAPAARSVTQLPTRRARPSPFSGERTEIEVAEMVIKRFAGELRFCAVLGGWHAWTGTHWARDERERARECVKAVARALAQEAAALFDRDVFRAAKRAASSAGTGAILDVMRSDPRVVFGAEEANRDPWLLSCENGTIDLRSGALRPHDPDDLITRCARGAYEAGATAPRFERFLSEIQPDAEVRSYLARLFGYAACGVVQEHVLGVLWGPGANGKSVLADTAMHVLGDYAKPGPSSLIVANGNHEPHPTDVASCVGSRLVVVHETKRGASFDASKVKLLTGGDRLTARRMHEDFFSFTPGHTLIMLSNYRPEADATDSALWRRVQLVPFNFVVPEENRDPTLATTIKRDETAGVLAWLVRGALDWQQRGLAPPSVVREQTAAYRAQEDAIAAFLDERCTVGASLRVRAGALYDAFTSWCKSSGARASRSNDFAAEMIGRAFERKRTNAGNFYLGIGLDAPSGDDGGREW